MWHLYFLILFLLFGLALGSFLNVVIYRLPRAKSLVKPRSRCPRCRKQIRYYDNIPVVSYLLLKGRCRNCRKKISGRYPLVELISALLFVGLYLKFQLSVSTLIYGTLFVFLIPIAFIDIDRKIIPDKLTVPGFILGLGLVFGFHFVDWKGALLGAFSASTVLWAFGLAVKSVLKKESLGFGDVKLLVMTGVYLGFPDMGIALFFGAVIALVYMFAASLLKKIQISDRIPFGPFIALGIVAYVYIGHELVKWYWGLF